MNRCDCCGKFRKDSDLVIQEDVDHDGFGLGQWLECRFCMSTEDEQIYFPKRQQNE